jgi:hypothetical protein
MPRPAGAPADGGGGGKCACEMCARARRTSAAATVVDFDEFFTRLLHRLLYQENELAARRTVR